MSYIVYPTVDLYLYDLRHGLGQTDAEIQQNRDRFAQKIPATLHADLFTRDTPFEIDYLELLDNQTAPLFNAPEYDSYLYPVRLSDTYSLLLDCSTTDMSAPHSIHTFATLQKLLAQHLRNQHPSLGQTWMLSGWPYDADLPDSAIAQLACDIYRATWPRADWQNDLQSTGRLLGGYLFELETAEPLLSELAPSDRLPPLAPNRHTLILIYPDATAAEQAATLLHKDWLKLWCYRHKIYWAYQQSRQLKQSLKQKFTEISGYTQDLQVQEYRDLSLDSLERQLSQAGSLFAKYGIEVTEFDFQVQTLALNLDNYQNGLAAMQVRLNQQALPSNIDGLTAFTQRPLLAQARKDAENLRPGLSLLEFNVNLIRAEVEVKRAKLEAAKAERDRVVQTQFAIWGLAIAGGAVVVDLSDQFPTVIVPTVTVTDAQPPKATLANEHPFGLWLTEVGLPESWLAPGISLVSGLLVTLILGSSLLLLKRLLARVSSR